MGEWKRREVVWTIAENRTSSSFRMEATHDQITFHRRPNVKSYQSISDEPTLKKQARQNKVSCGNVFWIKTVVFDDTPNPLRKYHNFLYLEKVRTVAVAIILALQDALNTMQKDIAAENVLRSTWAQKIHNAKTNVSTLHISVS